MRMQDIVQGAQRFLSTFEAQDRKRRPQNHVWHAPACIPLRVLIARTFQPHATHHSTRRVLAVLQWGSLEYHRRSLQNLAKAMAQTRRLCAVMLDTLGREVYVQRTVEVGDDGWPTHGAEVQVSKGDQVTLTNRTDVEQTQSLLPVNYKDLPGACAARLTHARLICSGAREACGGAWPGA